MCVFLCVSVCIYVCGSVCVCFCVSAHTFVPEHAESEFDTGHRLLSLSTYILTQVLEIQSQLPMLV